MAKSTELLWQFVAGGCLRMTLDHDKPLHGQTGRVGKNYTLSDTALLAALDEP
jgi:hypothetical protein